jgi:hypothetical protein
MAATVVRIRMRNPQSVYGLDRARPLVVFDLEGSGLVTQHITATALERQTGPRLSGRMVVFADSGGTQARVTVRLAHPQEQPEEAPRSAGSGYAHHAPHGDKLLLTIDNPPPDEDVFPILVDLIGEDLVDVPE